MELLDYLKKSPRGTLKEMSLYAGVTPNQIRHIAVKRRRASPAVGIKIEEFTLGEVSIYTLCKEPGLIKYILMKNAGTLPESKKMKIY